MNHTFKAGDRVRFGTFEGVLEKLRKDSLLLSTPDKESGLTFMPNGHMEMQPAFGPVLTLIKAAPREAREWRRVVRMDVEHSEVQGEIVTCGRPGIHVREVLPGEVVVTQEKLAKAWDDALMNIGPVEFDTGFKKVCKALGLPNE